MDRYKNCIYRFVNKSNEIIYIGKALDLEKRINNTGHISKHLPKECYDEIAAIQYIELKTDNDMDFAERYYIQKYNPKYNQINTDKPITFNIRELDIQIWFEYYTDKKEVLRQIEEFKSDNVVKHSEHYQYIKIKINADLLDYITVFSLQKNYHFYRYKKYKEFEERDEVHKLKKYMGLENLEEEYKAYQNVNKLERLRNIEIDITNKIRYELDTLLNHYKFLSYNFGYPFQETGDIYMNTHWLMNMLDFNHCINLGKNYFSVLFMAYCRFNTCSKYHCDGCNRDSACEHKKYRIKFSIQVECN